MNIKKTIKKILPKKLWNFLRHYKEIVRDFALNRGKEVCRISYVGFTLCYGRGSILIKKIRSGKIFEEEMCEKIVEELKKQPGTSFLDIGANIGLISLYVQSKLPNIQTYAFETGPHQLEYFGKTISENHLEKKIILSGKAFGNGTKKVTFMTHFSQDCSGDGFIDTSRAGEPIPITVDMITVDSWWNTIAKKTRIGVVKMDTEGAELWILQGAEKFLKEDKPIIFLEIEPKNLQVYPYKRDDILQWFLSHSYKLFTLDNEECAVQNFASFIGKYDTYIARPVV